MDCAKMVEAQKSAEIVFKTPNDSPMTALSVSDVDSDEVQAGITHSSEEKTYPVNYPTSVWVKRCDFDGWPKEDNFRLKQETITEMKDGEIVVKALCWAVMHYQGKYDVAVGADMIGEQLATVVESRNREFPENTTVVLGAGWRTVTRVNPREVLVRPVPANLSPGLPPKLCLGILGLPGLTAYFGLLELCKPVREDVVLVNGALGFVGSFVCQLAKLVGCKVIAAVAMTGQENWFRAANIDYVFSYRRTNPHSTISRLAPQGIDVYFDLLGGEFTQSILGNLKPTTRMCMCGDARSYRRKLPAGYTPDPYRLVSMVDKTVSNHTVFEYFHRFPEAESYIVQWVKQGKIKYLVHDWYGLFHLPEALQSLSQSRFAGHHVFVQANEQKRNRSTINGSLQPLL